MFDETIESQCVLIADLVFVLVAGNEKFVHTFLLRLIFEKFFIFVLKRIFNLNRVGETE